MKSASAGTASGCVIWLIVFAVLSACLLPVAMGVGGITSSSDFAAGAVAPMVCPADTRPHINSFETTSTDDNGVEQPATGYELQCLDSGGNVVKTDSVSFAFIWIGILAVAGLVIAAVLALVLAAPAGVLIGRALGRSKTAAT